MHPPAAGKGLMLGHSRAYAVQGQDRMQRSADHIKAWDLDYVRRGRVWGGAVRELPGLPVGSMVLEMGCGDGKTLSAMPAGWRVAAIEISLHALQLARKMRQDDCFILADGCRLPFQAERFDAVFAFHVAGHLFLEQRLALAREAARVLRPGGRLFFREFSKEDMRAGKGVNVEQGTFKRKSGIITHYFEEGEVAELFTGLKPFQILTHRWTLRARGEELQRAEVEAIFSK